MQRAGTVGLGYSKGMSEGVEDLFGNKLDDDTEDGFRDGTYIIRGASMKKGIYRSGRWEGRPFARFMYDMTAPDGKPQQVSQMLPWLPGKAFFEINFKLLTGMSLSEFNEYCRSQGFNDASAQSKFFLERFRGTEFEAEVRRKDQWYNVWEIKRRIDPQESDEREAQEAELAAKAEAMSAGPSPDAQTELRILRQLAADRGVAENELEEMAEKLFSMSLEELDEQAIDELQRQVQGPEPKPGPPENQTAAS